MARRILIALGLRDVELGILLVDDLAIQELNRRFLRRNRPTNVIAFPMQEGEFSVLNPHVLGDIVVSVETAYREATDFCLSRAETLTLFMIHGILHLAGYDHERSKRRACEMECKERELLRMVRREFSLRSPKKVSSRGNGPIR